MNTTPGCDVKYCFMCRSCQQDWRKLIALQKTNQHYKKGESIFSEGDPVKGIFFIYSGMVKIHKSWDKQKEMIIRFASPGDILGHRGIGEKSLYPVSATAMEPTTTCFVDTDFFLSTLKINPELSLKLTLFFAAELHEAERRMYNLAHLDAMGRVADLLLKLQTQFGIDKEGYLNIILSKQDISLYVGSTYETVFRMLQEMKEKRLIRFSGKKIAILKATALRELCDTN
ncbi:MAG: Crp/Fnr family transcriptional regulator [Bacteroidetes bacterium]|nr:Crp/Fnr family transcriptional regulator [Bacteroidota bacterium]